MIPKTFNADVEIKAKWKDQRIVFKNLANHGNVFDKFWQDKLWLPPLYFSNTKEDLSMLDGDTKILLLLGPLPNMLSEKLSAHTVLG